MFFPRLRNQANWAFVFLILVFGGGFVFLGVGSGGLDLGQLIRDVFGNSGSSGMRGGGGVRGGSGSISEAQKRADERPLNALRRRHLANALEKKGRTDDAIAAGPSTRGRSQRTSRRSGILVGSSFSRPTGISATASSRPSRSRMQASALRFDPRPPTSSASAWRGSDRGGPIRQGERGVAAGVGEVRDAATRAIATFRLITKAQPNEQVFFSLAQAGETLATRAWTVETGPRNFKLDPTTAAQIEREGRGRT